MKLTNEQILSIDRVLGKNIEQPIKGVLKFKLYKIKKELESVGQVFYTAIENLKEDEVLEILKQESEIKIEIIPASELENMELSIRDIAILEPILEM